MTDEERMRAEFEKYRDNKWKSMSILERADSTIPCHYEEWKTWQACWKLCGGMK